MLFILVMAFFMLGCRFSCSGMREDFANSDRFAVCDICKDDCKNFYCGMYKDWCLKEGVTYSKDCAKTKYD